MTGGPFVITRDGELADDGVFTLDAGFSRMHRIQGQSVDYATTYGGYAFVDVGVTPRHYAHVGELADGARVFVDWEVTPLDRPMTSVTHEPVTEGWRLSVTGGTVIGRRRDYDACGQILDTLADVVTYAPGWTREDVESLTAVWRDWHLNDMRAACAHMSPETLVREDDGYGRTRVACGAVNTCPDPSGQGYTYGRAWLYAPIPAAALLELSRLTALPAGRIPEWMTR
jgi:hypothetical protein